MRVSPLLLLVLLVGSGASPQAPTTQPIVRPHGAAADLGDYELAWHDEFDGFKLNTDEWHFRTDSKHWSTQRRENVVVADGFLKLMLKKEAVGGKAYTGAGVISKRVFKFGYYEARFRCPPGAGWHTSFWMQAFDATGGTGTQTAEQEIDVCEQDSVDPRKYGFNLHAWKQKEFKAKATNVKTPDLSADFHVWGCDFQPDRIRYFFDGKQVGEKETTGRNFNDQSIWLTSIASHLGGTKSVDDSRLPGFAEFDYVRFFKRAP